YAAAPAGAGAASGPLADDADAGARPRHRIDKSRKTAKPPIVSATLPSGRQPIARPVSATIAVQRIALSRSASDRPISAADGHIGSIRKRSTTPLIEAGAEPVGGARRRGGRSRP